MPKKKTDSQAGGCAANGEITNGHAIDRLHDFTEFRASLRSLNVLSTVYELIAWLNVDCVQLEHGGRHIEVSACRLHIVFSLTGLEVGSGRLGAHVREAEHRIEQTTKQVSEAKAEAGGKVNFGLTPAAILPTASLHAEASAQTTTRTESKDRTDKVKRRVIARPNCRWEIVEPDGGRLDGEYLTGLSLCELTRKPGANQATVSGQLVVLERDLHFDPENIGMFARRERTRNKLLEVFLAKHLSGGDRFGGRIVLATVEIEL